MQDVHPLIDSPQLIQSTLDAVSAHVSVVDEDGKIVFVNTSWRDFAVANQLRYENFGIGINYLEICESATGDWSQGAKEVAAGIRKKVCPLRNRAGGGCSRRPPLRFKVQD